MLIPFSTADPCIMHGAVPRNPQKPRAWVLGNTVYLQHEEEDAKVTFCVKCSACGSVEPALCDLCGMKGLGRSEDGLCQPLCGAPS